MELCTNCNSDLVESESFYACINCGLVKSNTIVMKEAPSISELFDKVNERYLTRASANDVANSNFSSPFKDTICFNDIAKIQGTSGKPFAAHRQYNYRKQLQKKAITKSTIDNVIAKLNLPTKYADQALDIYFEHEVRCSSAQKNLLLPLAIYFAFKNDVYGYVSKSELLAQFNIKKKNAFDKLANNLLIAINNKNLKKEVSLFNSDDCDTIYGNNQKQTFLEIIEFFSKQSQLAPLNISHAPEFINNLALMNNDSRVVNIAQHSKFFLAAVWIPALRTFLNDHAKIYSAFVSFCGLQSTTAKALLRIVLK